MLNVDAYDGACNAHNMCPSADAVVQGTKHAHDRVLFTMFFHPQVNYQYRNGTSFPTALRTLYADGGIPRFYRVSGPRLWYILLGPLCSTPADLEWLT